MKTTEAKFTKRIVVAEYEYEEYTLGGQLEGNETGAQALNTLKAEVLAVISGEETTPVDPKQEETKPAKKQKPKKEKKHEPKADHTDDEDTDDENPASEDAGIDGEGDQDDEATDSEDGDDSDDSSDSDEDSEDGSEDSDEEVPAPKPASKNAKKGSAKETGVKKGFRKKPQVYNRSIEQHKDIFSSILRSVAPEWKKSEASKAKAKKTSEVMNGKEFLDENGEVLPEFKNEVKKLMVGKK